MLKEYKLNILFLVETDTNMIMSEKDYKLKGFNTVFQNKKEGNEKTRIIALCNEKQMNEKSLKHRGDLSNEKFPSIWLEVQNETGKNVLICE